MLTRRGLTLFFAAALLLAPIGPLSPPVSASAIAPDSSASGDALDALVATLAALAIGMAIRVKDPATVAGKWRSRAQAASADYKLGVQQAAGDWEANTAASADNYAQGVQQAIGDGRFARGVREAGGAKYAQRAGEIGSTRFGPGVQASEGEMAKGVAPVLQAIASITLPPRRPKGDPGNMERANVVAATLRRLKTGGR